MEKDFTIPRSDHDILGIAEGATRAEVRAAFQALATGYYRSGDKGPEAETRFKEAVASYKRLLVAKPEPSAPESPSPEPSSPTSFARTEDVDAVADLLWHGFARKPKPRPGKDVQVPVHLRADEVASGVTRAIEITRRELCEQCLGSGAALEASITKCGACNGKGEVRQERDVLSRFTMVQTLPCPGCNGRGILISVPCPDCLGARLEQKQVSIQVAIPAGLTTGTQVRIRKAGDASLSSGEPGDLYLLLEVQA